jgi:hypothetical protein
MLDGKSTSAMVLPMKKLYPYLAAYTYASVFVFMALRGNGIGLDLVNTAIYSVIGPIGWWLINKRNGTIS